MLAQRRKTTRMQDRPAGRRDLLSFPVAESSELASAGNHTGVGTEDPGHIGPDFQTEALQFGSKIGGRRV